MKSVWRDAHEGDFAVFVERCSRCGRYPKVLKVHWFFRGLYCLRCIQDVLYDNSRNVSEVKRRTH